MKNITITILSILLLITGGYLLYDKVLMEEEKPTVNDNNNINLLTEEQAIYEGKRLYDKANEIYETWMLIPYCGILREEMNEQNIEKLGNEAYGNGYYYKSDFTNLEALKTYLKLWLSEDIVNNNVVKSSVTNRETYYNYIEDLSLLLTDDIHYGYVDYVLKDNTLYCRLDTGKGWLTNYLNKYDIKVNKIEENKITYTITSAYSKEDATSGIWGGENMPINYKDTKFVIEKNNLGNFVVTEFSLHD